MKEGEMEAMHIRTILNQLQVRTMCAYGWVMEDWQNAKLLTSKEVLAIVLCKAVDVARQLEDEYRKTGKGC